MAGRERDKPCRVKIRPSPLRGRDDEAMTRVAAGTAESRPPSDAMLRFVRALARAAAIADYQRENRTPGASSDNESGDLREI